MTATRLVPMLAWPSDAALTLPGSKSVANRLLVAAALAGRDVAIDGVPASDDVRLLLEGLRTLGFAVAWHAASERAVIGPRRADAADRGELACGNAGTTLRFLVSLAAITPGTWTLTGDAAMQRRPIAPLVAAWRQLGVDAVDTDGCPPVRVHGTDRARGGRVRLAATQSSQFVSSLLLVGAQLPDGLAIEFDGPLASPAYVDLTCRVLARFGIRAHANAWGAGVAPGAANATGPLRVDGDWSSAGVWTCLDHLTGSRVHATNLERGSDQADERLAEVLRAWPRAGDHTLDVTALPDQFMNLAIVAAHRAGTTRLVGAANLRIKESDRVAVMARELGKLGVDVQERPDGLEIRGGRPLRAATIDPANDHRIAMAFALAGLLAPGIAITDADCVAKSYPRFWHDLDTVVRQRRCIAVVGMRGAGKTTFARAFAAATGCEAIDTDAEFVAAHGPIAAFVERHGWPAFRAVEAEITARNLAPQRIVSIGAGAIETPQVQHLLRAGPIVLWLQASAACLRERLHRDPGGRPSVTGAPVLDELALLGARRDPLYAEVAEVRLDADLPTAHQVAQGLARLGAHCRWPGASP